MSGSRRFSPWARALLSSAIWMEKRRIDPDGVGFVDVSVALILQGIRPGESKRRNDRGSHLAEISEVTAVSEAASTGYAFRANEETGCPLETTRHPGVLAKE